MYWRGLAGPSGRAKESKVFGEFDEASVDAAGNDCIMRPSRCSAAATRWFGQWSFYQLFKNETTDRCGFLIWGDLLRRIAKKME
jgi:hypothetical protein